MESHGGSDVVVRTIQALAGLKPSLHFSSKLHSLVLRPLVKFENFPM